VFTPEGPGSEGIVPLGYIAARTENLKLGTRIIGVTGRAPGMAVKAFQTLDHISGGGRVIAGLGSGSKLQVEGLEGRPWGNPVRRMRDYTALLRQGLAGQALDYQGSEWSAPYRGPGNLGVPPRAVALDAISEIPIMIAAAEPQMITLAAEIADGWFPPAWGLENVLSAYLPLLEAGFARAGDGKALRDFEIWTQLDAFVDDDVEVAMRPFKEYCVALFHVHRPTMEARGFGEIAARLAELIEAGQGQTRKQVGLSTLDGKLWEEAVNSVPDEYIDGGWLVGSVARVRQQVKPWFDCGATGLIIRQGAPLSPESVVDNLDLLTAIAEEAGKTPLQR
jgi:alkanesulfonate monooxygenase SsuD/methylene tetrahydromethanopterin reductase-like flavin-dependent oxidoreductase (luciferase family)